MNRILLKKIPINYLFIFLFFSLYFSISSSLMLPKGEILRWVGPIVFIVIGIYSKIRRNQIFYLWPCYFNFLIPTFIISLFTLDYGLIYGMSKLLSFILIISSIYIFLNRTNVSPHLLMGGFSLMGYLLGIIIVYQFILLGSEIFNFGRFSGIYSNPNMLSSLSLSTTVCSLWMIFKSNKKFIGWVFFLAGIIVTISTGSRTGLIGLVIILIGSLFILFELKYTLQKIKFIFSIIIVSLVIAFIMNFIDIPALNRLLGEKTVDNSTGFSRGDIWIDGIPIFMEKPLFGWGYGSANYHIYINNPSEFSQWGIHNSFLIILIENGILGSVLYLAFFIFCFIKLKNKYKSLKLEIKQKKFTKIIFLLCIVLLINGMSESFLFSVGNPMSIPFWYSLLTLDIYLKKLSIQK